MADDRGSDIGKAIQRRRKVEGYTQEQLASRSGVPYTTLIKVESGAIKNPSVDVVAKIASVLSLSLDSLVSPSVYRGSEAIRRLFDDVLAALKSPGEWMAISGVSESDYLSHDQISLKKFLGELKARGFSQRILSAEDETVFIDEDHIEYRAVPCEYFSAVPFYVYGDRIAMLIWGEPLQVIIIQNEHLSGAMRKMFLFAWDRAQQFKK